MKPKSGILGNCAARRPAWLKKKIDLSSLSSTKNLLRDLKLETVCEQALCPNIGECFACAQATFLILGTQCTRSCSFCNVAKGAPGPLDESEPARVGQAVKALGLRHVVVTSVTRDDLVDGGAGIFAKTVLEIRKNVPAAKIEILIPDFKLSLEALRCVIESSPDIIAHNVETVPSLYQTVRKGSNYQRSLEVLRNIKSISPRIKTKSGIMLGLGEEGDEVLGVLSDLRNALCDFLSIGHYLAPSAKHHSVVEYIAPDQFDYYKKEALGLGFLHVASGPYVRSSYMAEEYLSDKSIR